MTLHILLSAVLLQFLNLDLVVEPKHDPDVSLFFHALVVQSMTLGHHRSSLVVKFVLESIEMLLLLKLHLLDLEVEILLE